MSWSSFPLFLLTHFRLIFILFLVLYLQLYSIPTSIFSPTLTLSRFFPFSFLISIFIYLSILSIILLVTFECIAHETFIHIASCTLGCDFDYWIFEPSFPLFLLPYHPESNLWFISKTPLRPWDHMFSLIVSTCTGSWDSISVWTLSCCFFWVSPKWCFS